MGLTIVGESTPIVTKPVVVKPAGTKPVVVKPVVTVTLKPKDPTIKRNVVAVKVRSVASSAPPSLTPLAKNLCSRWKVACREEAAKIPHGFLFRCKPITTSTSESHFAGLLECELTLRTQPS